MSPHHRPLISVFPTPYPPLGLKLSYSRASFSLYQSSSPCSTPPSVYGILRDKFWFHDGVFWVLVTPTFGRHHLNRVLSPGTTSGVSACSLSRAPQFLLRLRLLITSIRQPHSVVRYERLKGCSI